MNAFDTEIENSASESPASLLAMASLVFVTSAIAARLRAQVEAQAPDGFQEVTVFHLDPPHIENSNEVEVVYEG